MRIQKDAVTAAQMHGSTADVDWKARNRVWEIGVNGKFHVRRSAGNSNERAGQRLQVEDTLFHGLAPKIVQRYQTVRAIESPQPVTHQAVRIAEPGFLHR